MEDPALAALYGSSVTGRVAIGPRAGRAVERVGDRVTVDDAEHLTSPRCARVQGFSLHADVVTVTHDLSPSDFHLYSAAEDPVVFVNESPYHGDFAAGLVQAYVGVPATHLVNSQGIMLRIYGEDCVPGSPFDSQCFIKDGELGTLPPDVYGFIDLREGFDGYIYGLVDPAAEWPFDPPCVESPCELQRIDPATRTIVATAPVVLGGQEFAVLRPDPQGGSVAIVAGFGAPFTYSFEDLTTFDVFFVAI